VAKAIYKQIIVADSIKLFLGWVWWWYSSIWEALQGRRGESLGQPGLHSNIISKTKQKLYLQKQDRSKWPVVIRAYS
jgi:hypothetical protein